MNDPPLAAGLAVGPVGTASVDAAGIRLVLERMIPEGIELPDLLAGRRIEGRDPEISGRDVHHAIDHDRRALDRLAGASFQLPRMVSPGRLEPRHVFAVDLIESGIPHATGVIPHARPVADSRRLSSGLAPTASRQADDDAEQNAWCELLRWTATDRQPAYTQRARERRTWLVSDRPVRQQRSGARQLATTSKRRPRRLPLKEPQVTTPQVFLAPSPLAGEGWGEGMGVER